MTEALRTDDGQSNGYAARGIGKGLKPGALARAAFATDVDSAAFASDVASGERPSLILGYDGTDSALKAAAWAAAELLPNGKLVVVHAARSPHVPARPPVTPHERHRLGCALLDELLLEGTSSLIDVDLEIEISDEDPVSALTDAARRHGARAIVVGYDRRSQLHRALGTVARKLLDASPAPVVVVPLA
jgi:nucleotide-binding universal stress UspA family protein